MKFIKKHPLAFIIILGLLIRFSLLFLDYSWDVNSFISWGKDLNTQGFVGFYEMISSEVYASKYPNYPPFSLFLFYLIYPLQKIIFSLVWYLNTTFSAFPSNIVLFVENRSFIAGLFKLPAILADLLLALLMMRFTKNYKLLIFVLIFLNPVVFYISSYWGQIDSVPLLLILYSIYFLIFSKKYIISGLLFTSAVLFKPTVLLFLPIYLIYFVKKYGLNKFIRSVFISNILFWFSFFPFLNIGNLFAFPYTTYLNRILLGQDLTLTTNSAYNFWAVLTGFNNIQESTKFIFNFSYQQIGLLIAFGFMLVIIFIFLNKKSDLKNFIYSITLSVYSSFLFLTKMHERYLLLLLPFICLLVIIEKKYLKIFFVFSIISFLNLYHSWPVPRNEFLLSFLSNSYIVSAISILNIVIFLKLLLNFKK